MKSLKFFICSCLISVFFLASTADSKGTVYPYKKCSPLGLHHQLWLYKGQCYADVSKCEALRDCTTFHGSIVVRALFQPHNGKKIFDATFPALREITGYLIIIYLRDLHSLSNLFPNLAVIRGQEQVVHYSLVIYNTLLEKVILPSLTVVKSGGVRIDHNDQMCYIKTIRWRSIVLDKSLTEENFGIAFYQNNENCYRKCLIGSCYAPSGHDRTRQQYCFGPGGNGNAECQKLCRTSCGVQGCVDGTVDQCCHEECLGGCTRPGSNRHCHACMNYRAGPYGFCVSQCPSGMYVVRNFECRSSCPLWAFWSFKAVVKYYEHNGHCVKECPAGHIANMTSRSCEKCKTSVCPRECNLGKEVKIAGLSAAKILSGCTVVTGSIKIEIRAGPDDITQKLREYLGAIRQINGYIEIRESKALTSLDFFHNLERIETSQYPEKDYALLVFRNSNLKSLWKPKKLHVRKGLLSFHSNAYLCKSEINALGKMVVGNTSKAITETKNGYLGSCDVTKFSITAKEVKDKRACRSHELKCVNVTWFHQPTVDSRNFFYIVNYRIISNVTNGKKPKKDKCCPIEWMKVDVSPPKLKPKENATGPPANVEMYKQISNLVPFAVYSFFVETYVLDGEVRKSGVVTMRLSEAAPGRPLGLRALYLSHSEIEITWKPPDNPNGIITEYRVYYERKNYSFWNTDLDWCSRDVTPFSAKPIAESSKTSNAVLNDGFCRTNITCDCEASVKESRLVREDKNFLLFNRAFEDAIIKQVFVKQENDDDDDDKKKGGKKKVPPIVKIIKSNESGGSNTVKIDQTMSTIRITRKPRTTPKAVLSSTARSSTKNSMQLTPPPAKKYLSVSGNIFKFVIKNLSHFQEYKIKVCPCNKVGCRESFVCASTFGQTDFNPDADKIPGRVIVNVVGTAYNVSWTAPPSPNGVVLRYDIRTKHFQNQERLRCRLGHLPTTLFETGAAPGNYSIKIRAITPASNGSWTPYTYFTIEEKRTESAARTNTVIIGIGSASAFLIILLALAIVYCTYVRKNAQMGVPGVLYASVNPEYLTSNEVYIPDEWEVPRDKIELIKELGKGSFGMVYEGIAYDIVEEEPKLRVAVKTVNENASIRDRIEFLQEASIMKAFNCYHIVRLLGVVSQGQPTLVVMELMERGDLKSFLRNRRPEERGGRSAPSLAEILQMAAEIADGMSYLAARKFVHRDLAARNCMVTADFTVKIGDFGMTRDIYETDYYRKGGKGLLPVRWMAPESLKDGIFTTASDVWSYGVVLWEMATLAAQPYPGKSNEDVLRFVVDGGVLEQPDDCSNRLYNMMCNCWKTDPRARPSFLEVVQFLENDVSETFESVSYYHEMKRKLLEATETNLLKGPDQMNVAQVRRGSLKVGTNQVDPSGGDTASTESEETWREEAAPFVKKPKKEQSQERSNSVYENDGEGARIRYVELPAMNVKSMKNDGKPVPV